MWLGYAIAAIFGAGFGFTAACVVLQREIRLLGSLTAERDRKRSF